jgi:hypothetical protein
VYLKTKILTVLAAGAMIATVGVAPASAAPPATVERSVIAEVRPAVATTSVVTGTLADGSTFVGTVSDLTASVVGGAVQVTGTISGTITDLAGNTTTVVAQTFTAILQGASCEILELDLGPLHLDLLGLVIDLAPVHLDITAEPGPGNLLGNLLCAVAGLLDRDGPLTVISNLLNRLFALLD